jgi:hypothetical protein
MEEFARASGYTAGTGLATLAFACAAALLRADASLLESALHCPRVRLRHAAARRHVDGLSPHALTQLTADCVHLAAPGLRRTNDAQWDHADSLLLTWRELSAAAPASVCERSDAATLQLVGWLCLCQDGWEDTMRKVLGRVPDGFMRRVSALERQWDAADTRALLHSLTAHAPSAPRPYESRA